MKNQNAKDSSFLQRLHRFNLKTFSFLNCYQLLLFNNQKPAHTEGTDLR